MAVIPECADEATLSVLDMGQIDFGGRNAVAGCCIPPTSFNHRGRTRSTLAAARLCPGASGHPTHCNGRAYGNCPSAYAIWTETTTVVVGMRTCGQMIFFSRRKMETSFANRRAGKG